MRLHPDSGSSVTYIGHVTWSADGQMRNPMGIALNAAGNLYVSDYQDKRIQKFDLNANFGVKKRNFAEKFSQAYMSKLIRIKNPLSFFA